jgi:hypothetical protein
MLLFTRLLPYKLLFMFELLVSEFLFSFRLKKRKLFALRYALGAAVCLTAAAFFPVPVFNAAYMSFQYAVLFGMTVLLHALCFDEKVFHILFCLIAGYTVQHIAYCLSNGVLLMTGLNYNVFGVYTDEVMSDTVPPLNIAIGYIVTFVIFYLTNYLAFLLFGNRIRKNENLRLKNRSLMLATGLTLLVSVVINAVVVYTVKETNFIVLASIYGVLCCGFIMYMQFGMLTATHLQKELETVSRLLRESYARFESAKENIELVNLKCHDLKHQIRRIGKASFVDESALREIEDVIAVYDASVETGNPVLDMILTEKSLFCEQNGIRLTCLADGARLNFIKDADLYALFGNAVDNAFSAVIKISEPEKRYIGLTVRKMQGFISVNINNYYTGQMRLDPKGFPVTTKADTDYHGYGLKSMRYIVEKYRGILSIDIRDNVFNLNMVFPAGGDGEAAVIGTEPESVK